MKLSILSLLMFLVSCTYESTNYAGKCFQPFIYSGKTIKVINCTNNKIESNYCIIEKKTYLGHTLKDTIFISNLEGSLEVNCSEY